MTTHPVTIRPAVVDDSDFLRQHDSHVHRDVLIKLIDEGQILVAVDAESVCGWLRWNLFWDEIPFMNMLFVVERLRGEGLGTALVAKWENSLRSQGFTTAMTSTQSDERAQTFYRARGYLDCGVLLQPGEPSEIFMRKDLG